MSTNPISNGSSSGSMKTARPRHFGFNIAFITLVAAILGVGVAYYIDSVNQKRLELPSLDNSTPLVTKIVGGQSLGAPAPWFRFFEPEGEEFVERIELIFALPLGVGDKVGEVQVVIAPLREARPGAELLDAVYLHQFKPEQISGPTGLIGKPLKDATGFEGEIVWYDPISPNPFVAKCRLPVAETSTQKCIRTVRISEKLAATYKFDFELAGAWKRFDIEAGKWLAKINGI